jgi:dTMP kinase
MSDTTPVVDASTVTAASASEAVVATESWVDIREALGAPHKEKNEQVRDRSLDGRGAFIVLEGLDRSGKTTQVARLIARLNEDADIDEDAVGMRFPDRTSPTGVVIDKYLRKQHDDAITTDDHAMHLLFSANRWEQAHRIRNTLIIRGATIVCDRYAASGVAYSSAKGLPLAWCMASDTGLPAPDLTIYLDIDPEQAATRAGFGQERHEQLLFQLQVADKFRAPLFTSNPRWRCVDAARDADAVAEDIWQLVKPVVQACAAGLYGMQRQLWTH